MGTTIKRIHGIKDLSGDSAELRELVGDRAREDLARFFGVSQTTLQRWLDGRVRPPAAVMRLARLRWRGDLSAVFGPAWFELSASEAGLLLPGWRRPFSPGDLRSTWARLQQLECLRLENDRLRRERAAAWQAAEAAEDAAGWYRSQLRLESRLGAMLQRIGA